MTCVLFCMSCSKNQDVQPEPIPDIDEKNLTECPGGSSCSFWYNDFTTGYNSYFAAPNANYRMFFAQHMITDGQITTTLSIQAPKQDKSFTLSEQNIKDGRVVVQTGCPACYSIPFKLVGGYVKGINLSPRVTRPSGANKWLLEVKIIREMQTSPVTRDSIFVKQYFYPMY